MAMKGNNGRAGRKALIRRVSTVFTAFVVCIGCLLFTGLGRSAKTPLSPKRKHHNFSSSLLMHSSSVLRQSLRSRAEMVSKTAMHDFDRKKQKKKIKSLKSERPLKAAADRPHQGENPEVINVSFDDDSDKEAIKLLLEARVHLVDISYDNPKAVTGDFCTLNFAAHKANPALVPMFRHLVDASPECEKVRYRVLLSDYVRHATKHDAEPNSSTKSLNLTAVVFHESRCGSTLVSNSLIGMNPEKHRVYSESSPPINALQMCGETFKGCSLNRASRVLKDVMYAMGRTNDPNEERVFFKIQSIGTRTLNVFQHAFPTVPFMFVYREPVQVMMSQLKYGSRNANCVRPRSRPPPSVVDVCTKKGFAVGELNDEEYCAAHLASITEAALEGLRDGFGFPINYADLPAILWEKVLPAIGVPMTKTEIEAMEEISKQYSKAGDGRSVEFHGDSERKEQMASEAVRDASALFLQDSFDALQATRVK